MPTIGKTRRHPLDKPRHGFRIMLFNGTHLADRSQKESFSFLHPTSCVTIITRLEVSPKMQPTLCLVESTAANIVDDNSRQQFPVDTGARSTLYQGRHTHKTARSFIKDTWDPYFVSRSICLQDVSVEIHPC